MHMPEPHANFSLSIIRVDEMHQLGFVCFGCLVYEGALAHSQMAIESRSRQGINARSGSSRAPIPCTGVSADRGPGVAAESTASLPKGSPRAEAGQLVDAAAVRRKSHARRRAGVVGALLVHRSRRPKNRDEVNDP